MVSLTEERNASIAEFVPELDRLAADVMADWKVPGAALAVVQDGKVALARAYSSAIFNSYVPAARPSLPHRVPHPCRKPTRCTNSRGILLFWFVGCHPIDHAGSRRCTISARIVSNLRRRRSGTGPLTTAGIGLIPGRTASGIRV
jgi:hypothetical protein